MTQQEFTDRTGLRVTDEEYREIEEMYMAVPDMEKDEFCRHWTLCGGNPLAMGLARRATALGGSLEKSRRELADIRRQTGELADFLIGKSCVHNDTDLYHEAVRMAGQRAVTIRKVQMGLPLWQEDVDYINENLK